MIHKMSGDIDKWYEDMLQQVVDRFTSLLKDQQIPFTESLPENIENDVNTIRFVLYLFDNVLGVSFPETDDAVVFKYLLAKNFIIKMKEKRPDVIYSISKGDYI